MSPSSRVDNQDSVLSAHLLLCSRFLRAADFDGCVTELLKTVRLDLDITWVAKAKAIAGPEPSLNGEIAITDVADSCSAFVEVAMAAEDIA